jgi:hypothetical protein
MWRPISTAPRTGITIRAGWFADEPQVAPLEYERTLRWDKAAWRDCNVWTDRDAEWTPTHWWKPTTH